MAQLDTKATSKIGNSFNGFIRMWQELAARLRRRRVPEILQMNATECGVACLAMVLAYYKLRVPLAEIRERCGAGRDGASALAIVNAARSYGLRVRAVSLKENNFRFVKLPAIVHWQFNHFVVLEGWWPNRAALVDPALGRTMVSSAEFEANFTGVVLILEPGVSFKPLHRPDPLSLQSYIAYSWHTPGLLVQIIVASVVLQLLGLLVPALTQLAVDRIIPGQMREVLPILGLGLVVLLVTYLVINLLRAALLVYLQARLEAALTPSFFEHLLSLPYTFFQQRSVGDLMNRLASNTIIRDTLSSQLVQSLLDGGLVAVYLVILLSQSVSYGLWTLMIAAVQVSLILATSRAVRRASQTQLAAQGRAQGYLVEGLGGIATLKGAGAEGVAFNHWSGLFFESLNASTRASYLSAVVDTVLAAIRTFAPVLLLWVGVGQVLDGQMSVGQVLALNALSLSFLTPLASLVTSLQRLQIVQAHFERLADVLAAEPERWPDQATIFPPRLSGQIELKNVSFRYAPNTPPVLHKINLHIQPGQKVAIVGPTGSGKSTLGKLLLGLYQPTEGQICYDGYSLADLNIEATRRQFGTVLQEASIFSGSISHNISFNDPEMGMERVIAAAQLADLHKDVGSMPMGYETFVAEGGSALSGGQRQRLALARAVAHSPAILLLDEATSHLDVLTEKTVDRNLDGLACTRIVIAHRLSTVLNADLIVVLEAGRIIETGTHAELVQRQGFYARLIQHQLDQQAD